LSQRATRDTYRLSVERKAPGFSAHPVRPEKFCHLFFVFPVN
jgi:hypothetical protein